MNIEKLFSRPFNLTATQGYSKSLSEVLPNLIGFRFKLSLLFYQEGTMEVWRDTSETTNLVRKILSKLEDGSFEFETFIKKYTENFNHVESLAAKPDTKILKQFGEAWRHGGAGMVIIYWIAHIEDVHCRNKFAKHIENMETLRKKSEKMYYYGQQFYEKIISIICTEKRIRSELGNCMLEEELITYFESGTIPSMQELEKRNLGAAFINGNIKLTSKEKVLEELTHKRYQVIQMKNNEIKGIIVHPGIVRGKVKIIKNKNTYKNIKEGDILVTSMTSPNHLPAMKIAAAIITDEGGTLSHASIASRELKLPCIIGTKFATQLFKDGDMVEVDANKGVVRKL